MRHLEFLQIKKHCMHVASLGGRIIGDAHPKVNKADHVSLSTDVTNGLTAWRNQLKLNDVIAECVPYESSD
jgi:hypothetical protein